MPNHSTCFPPPTPVLGLLQTVCKYRGVHIPLVTTLILGRLTNDKLVGIYAISIRRDLLQGSVGVVACGGSDESVAGIVVFLVVELDVVL